MFPMQRNIVDDPKAGSYWGVKRICQRLRCSERTLFRLYRDYSFPMIMWPKGYAKFGVRGTWWISEPLIQKWLLAVWEVQRKEKLRGSPWWKRLEGGHKLIVPEGLRTAEEGEKKLRVRGRQ